VADLIMPKMGDAMTEGKVIRWMKEPGAAVKKGEAVAEIETDKVNVDLEAEWDGTLAKILVGAGEVAAVGAPIAVIARPGEPVQEAARPEPAQRATGAQGPTPAPPGAAATTASATAAPRTAATATDGALRASPLARKLAEQHGIALETIKGSGPDGRIVKEDVEAALDARRAGGSRPLTPPSAPAPAGRPGPVPVSAARDVPLTRMRQAIARRMTDSKQHIPHIYLTASVGMDAALALRKQLNDTLDDARRVSVNDLVVKAAALALRRFPNLNASFGEGAVHQHGDVNINVAVALPDGLVSPTIYHCDTRPLWDIAADTKAAAERARAGRLRPNDLTGGTFTISNLGMFGIDVFSAIITPPQAAALAVAAAKPQPVVANGQVAVATIMQVTASADHRVTDGAEVAQFLNEVRRLLEQPVWLVAAPPA
jgi:pyruvate dehydrogenase E2 component (dihydrolipoamide acetyltransferase)